MPGVLQRAACQSWQPKFCFDLGMLGTAASTRLSRKTSQLKAGVGTIFPQSRQSLKPSMLDNHMIIELMPYKVNILALLTLTLYRIVASDMMKLPVFSSRKLGYHGRVFSSLEL